MCASAIRAISVLLGERWKKMRSEERRVFTLQAKALADEQKRLNPDCWKRKRTNSVSTHMRLHSFTHCFVFLLHPASLSCRAVKEIKATEKKRGQLTEPVVYTHTHTRTHIRTLKKRAMHNRILRFSSIFVLSWSPKSLNPVIVMQKNKNKQTAAPGEHLGLLSTNITFLFLAFQRCYL